MLLPPGLNMLRCRQRASQNLTVALAPDDFKPASELGPGDFLVRGLAGFDPRAGVLLVGGGARLVSTLIKPSQKPIHLLRGLAGFEPRAGVLLVGGSARLVRTLRNPLNNLSTCFVVCSWRALVSTLGT